MTQACSTQDQSKRESVAFNLLRWRLKQHLSTSSKTCTYLKRVQIFSRLRTPQNILRHQQGHQRASALLVSINIIQSTIIAVNGVKYQKFT